MCVVSSLQQKNLLDFSNKSSVLPSFLSYHAYFLVYNDPLAFMLQNLQLKTNVIKFCFQELKFLFRQLAKSRAKLRKKILQPYYTGTHFFKKSVLQNNIVVFD